MEKRQLIKISEKDFSEKTKDFPDLMVPEYVNRFAWVVPISPNEIYVNVKGDCFIVSSFPLLDSLLDSIEGKGQRIEDVKKINFPAANTIEIKSRVKIFLDSLGINAGVIDDRVIQILDKKIARASNRSELFSDLYYVFGEYFCYAFNSKIIWKWEMEEDLEKRMPVLFYIDQNKYLYFALNFHCLITDPLVDTPLKLSIDRLFSLVNKNI